MPFSISQLADLCGVSENTLRSWERRYQLPAPSREPNGYRAYSDAQADILRQMARLVRVGVPPRHAARHVQGDQTALYPAPPAEFVKQLRGRPWDGEVVTTELELALHSIDLAQMADDWLLPMLALVGDEWSAGQLGIDQEHALSAAVMGQLNLLRAAALPTRREAPRVLAGLPAGSRHELGIFAFAVTLQRAGWPVVYLGPDLPADSWTDAVEQHAPTAVVTAIPMANDVGPARHLIDRLCDARPGLLIGIGGAQQDAIDNPTALRLGHRFVPALDRLNTALTEPETTVPQR